MSPPVAVIGAGPAGLMATEVLAAAGREVIVYDAMPSAARKFLMAGKGGMNISHSEPLEHFLGRYGARRTDLAPRVEAFGPEAIRAWMAGLGVESFVGSSGRVFPKEMKAAPLLRAWLARLRAAGVRFEMHHRWLGWAESADTAPRTLRLLGPEGEIRVESAATVLALGGASWPRLGSDAAWVPLLEARRVALAPLRPANCGFERHWSEHFLQRFEGAALKNVAARVGDGPWTRGECNVTAYGIEGGLIYAVSAALRDACAAGTGELQLDLAPGRSEAQLAAELARPRGRDSLANHLRRRAGLEGVKAALLRERLAPASLADPAALARAIKALPLPVDGPRPIAEAISSAGGVPFEALDESLMLRALPGVFCAGEMLDWEAPTGGYLLTACFATGRAAGAGAARWPG